jgi:hypothetical protein
MSEQKLEVPKENIEARYHEEKIVISFHTPKAIISGRIEDIDTFDFNREKVKVMVKEVDKVEGKPDVIRKVEVEKYTIDIFMKSGRKFTMYYDEPMSHGMTAESLNYYLRNHNKPIPAPTAQPAAPQSEEAASDVPQEQKSPEMASLKPESVGEEDNKEEAATV